MSTGMYIDVWDNIEFLVLGYPKSQYKKVQSEKEGVGFIRIYLKSKGKAKPKWARGGEAYYPSLSKICRMLGVESVSSNDSAFFF